MTDIGPYLWPARCSSGPRARCFKQKHLSTREEREIAHARNSELLSVPRVAYRLRCSNKSKKRCVSYLSCKRISVTKRLRRIIFGHEHKSAESPATIYSRRIWWSIASLVWSFGSDFMASSTEPTERSSRNDRPMRGSIYCRRSLCMETTHTMMGN